MRSKQKFSLPKYATLLLAVCIVLPLSTKILESAVKPKQLTNDVLVTAPAAQDPSEDFSTDYLVNLASSSLASARPQPLYGLWWITDEGWNLKVTETEAYSVSLPEPYFNAQNPQSVGPLFIEKITDALSEQGFTKDSNNTSKLPSSTSYDPEHYDYILGFKKDGDVCLITIDGDDTSAVRLACATAEQIKAAKTEQVPFLTALQKNYPKKNYVVTILKQTDNAAKVAVNWRRTGSHALLSKANGVWKVIYSGQDQPSCEVLSQYQFPEELEGECY